MKRLFRREKGVGQGNASSLGHWTRGIGWESQSSLCLSAGLFSSTRLRSSMGVVSTTNPILHRSWSRVIETAWPISSSRIGIIRCASVPSSRVGLSPHCLVDGTLESEDLVRVPTRNTLQVLGSCEMLIDQVLPISKFTEIHFNFRSSVIDITEDATKLCGLMNLSGGSIGKTGEIC